ncbi:MAG TPA: S24 family peptidase [Isosphaeraceae bacterium]|nr:S24 family peptidase [Isosphaeraceae bacterium]
MARRKTLPESVRAKLALAERLGALRSELFGERGGPEMARRLGIPVRTWYNYEGGVTVPAEVVLKIIELTSVEPAWLLHGKGAKFRQSRPGPLDPASSPALTVGALLRTALQLLENEESPSGAGTKRLGVPEATDGDTAVAKWSAAAPDQDRDEDLEGHGPLAREMDPQSGRERREWLAAQRENRCIRVTGDAMAPVLADGAMVAFSPREEDPTQLHRKMVVAWLAGEHDPVVRWFEHCGRYALLRAQNPKTTPQPETLVDLDDPRDPPRFRRVLWFHTPH